MNKSELIKKLKKLGIKVVKGKYVKKSQIISLARKNKKNRKTIAHIPRGNISAKVDCTYDEINNQFAHSTYAPDTYYVDFQKLPECVQKEFEKVAPEIDDSRYTVNTPTAFLRFVAKTKDGAELAMEIHLGEISEEDREDEEGADNIADEMKATFDWDMQDVYFEVLEYPKERVEGAELTVKTTGGKTVKVDREKLKNVGNTNGRDIKCRKCKEPFENYYVVEDFTDEEIEDYVLLGPQMDDPHGEPTRVAALDGCPACGE